MHGDLDARDHAAAAPLGLPDEPFLDRFELCHRRDYLRKTDADRRHDWPASGMSKAGPIHL